MISFTNGIAYHRKGFIITQQDLNSKRTYQYMFNAFISLLIIGFIHLPLNTYSLVLSDSLWTIGYYKRIYMLTTNLILIGLYGLGLFVVSQRSRIGLLAFAWFVTFIHILATVIVLCIFFLAIFSTSNSIYSFEKCIGTVLYIVLSFASIIILGISIKHVLDLSKLIRNNSQLMTEEI